MKIQKRPGPKKKEKEKKNPVDMTPPPSKPTGHNRLSLELLNPGPNYSNKYAWLKQTSNAEKERSFEHLQLVTLQNQKK